MGTPLSLTSRRRDDGTHVVSVRGELDHSNIDDFVRALQATAAEGGTVTVDLSAVEYLDSAAINAFFAHVGQIEIVAGDVLLPLLEVSGLADVVAVHPPP